MDDLNIHSTYHMGSRSMPHPNGVTMFEGCELEDTSFEVCLKTSSSWDTFGKD